MVAANIASRQPGTTPELLHPLPAISRRTLEDFAVITEPARSPPRAGPRINTTPRGSPNPGPTPTPPSPGRPTTTAAAAIAATGVAVSVILMVTALAMFIRRRMRDRRGSHALIHHRRTLSAASAALRLHWGSIRHGRSDAAATAPAAVTPGHHTRNPPADGNRHITSVAVDPDGLDTPPHRRASSLAAHSMPSSSIPDTPSVHDPDRVRSLSDSTSPNVRRQSHDQSNPNCEEHDHPQMLGGGEFSDGNACVACVRTDETDRSSHEDAISASQKSADVSAKKPFGSAAAGSVNVRSSSNSGSGNLGSASGQEPHARVHVNVRAGIALPPGPDQGACWQEDEGAAHAPSPLASPHGSHVVSGVGSDSSCRTLTPVAGRRLCGGYAYEGCSDWEEEDEDEQPREKKARAGVGHGESGAVGVMPAGVTTRVASTLGPGSLLSDPGARFTAIPGGHGSSTPEIMPLSPAWPALMGLHSPRMHGIAGSAALQTADVPRQLAISGTQQISSPICTASACAQAAFAHGCQWGFSCCAVVGVCDRCAPAHRTFEL